MCEELEPPLVGWLVDATLTGQLEWVLCANTPDERLEGVGPGLQVVVDGHAVIPSRVPVRGIQRPVTQEPADTPRVEVTFTVRGRQFGPLILQPNAGDPCQHFQVVLDAIGKQCSRCLKPSATELLDQLEQLLTAEAVPVPA